MPKIDNANTAQATTKNTPYMKTPEIHQLQTHNNRAVYVIFSSCLFSPLVTLVSSFTPHLPIHYLDRRLSSPPLPPPPPDPPMNPAWTGPGMQVETEDHRHLKPELKSTATSAWAKLWAVNHTCRSVDGCQIYLAYVWHVLVRLGLDQEHSELCS